MPHSMQETKVALSAFERWNCPRGWFLRYARGRTRAISLRVMTTVFVAAMLSVAVSWQFTVFALVLILSGEAIDLISLTRSRRRMAAGGKFKRELRLSIVTASLQAATVGYVVAMAVVRIPSGFGDFFVLAYLFAAVMNAGMVYFFNPRATTARLIIYAATLIWTMMWQWNAGAGGPEMFYEILGVALMAYVAYRVIEFSNHSFRRQVNDQRKWHELSKSLAASNDRLRQSEQHMRKLALVAEHANDCIIVTNGDRTITWVNDSFTRVTGYTLAEAVGRTPADLLNGPRTSQQAIDRIHEAGTQMRPLRVEILNYTKTGEPVWMETNIVPVPGNGEEEDIVIAVERNITHAKKREAELAAAKKTAEDSEMAKGRFLATMSHEIRTPMTGIIGMADLLADQPMPEEARQYVGTLQDSAQSLLRIVNDILDLSRLEAGKLSISPTVFSVPRFFDSLQDTLAPRAAAKGLSLTFDVPDDAPLVLGDEGRIRQILVNLIDNALKFTDSGGVTLSIQTTRIAQTCRFAVDVSDSGIGMSPQGLDRIFGSFEQAEDDTATRFGGTGLGLAISRQLAREMGGDLTAVSREGEGSCFSLFLPLPCAMRPEGAVPPAPLSVVSGPAPENRFLAGRRILIAEDNATNRTLVEKYLSKSGAELSFANDGIEAVDMAARVHHDLILMDMSMPHMDGLEATRRIRAAGDTDPPVIIALTANARKDDRDTCIEAGMDDFMTKPLRKRELLARLEEVFSETDTRKAAGTKAL